MLRRLSFKGEYFTGQDNLVNEFYKPCFNYSATYDRSVGAIRDDERANVYCTNTY